MKLLVQRSLNSNVSINDRVNGSIDNGLVVFVSFTHGDNENIVDKMVDKLINLRIFNDENNLMNLSLIDVKSNILSISQFTLYADASKGRRPSFVDAMKSIEAENLYNYFNKTLKKYNIKVESGIFGSDMKVSIINDGPVTIMLDSKELKF